MATHLVSGSFQVSSKPARQPTCEFPHALLHNSSSHISVSINLKRRQRNFRDYASKYGTIFRKSSTWTSQAVLGEPGSLEISRNNSSLEVHDKNGLLMLKGLTFEGLEEWCVSKGEKPSRALQLWRWMYYDNMWMRCFEDAAGSSSSSFGRAFRDKVEPLATVDGGLELADVHEASDGTRKLVFRVSEGPAAGGKVEAVLIPILRSSGRKERITLCVSSQLGCAMNCQFCLTGRMGLGGNLLTAQIVEQLVEARRYLASVGDKTPITNVVFMGMGEPLHNLDAVLAATSIFCHPMGLHMSHNKISVSTVGLVPEMERFCRESSAQLAVSLHATTDEVRDWIVPVNRRYPIHELMASLRSLFPSQDGAGSTRRHVLIEYLMLRGINDTEDDARRLLELLEGIEAKINLLIFNPHVGTMFAASTDEQIARFRSILIQGGRVCTVRDSRGDDQMAACGQLGDPVQRGGPLPPILAPPARFREGFGGGAGAPGEGASPGPT